MEKKENKSLEEKKKTSERAHFGSEKLRDSLNRVNSRRRRERFSSYGVLSTGFF